MALIVPGSDSNDAGCPELRSQLFMSGMCSECKWALWFINMVLVLGFKYNCFLSVVTVFVK